MPVDPGTVISVIETCYRYGKVLVDMCQTYWAADQELHERVTTVEYAWTKTRLQIDFVGRISHVLDDDHLRCLDSTLLILSTKLSVATDKLRKLHDQKSSRGIGIIGWPSKVKRGKYVYYKDALDEVIREVEVWRSRFDPTWYLILRSSNPDIDRELNRESSRQRRSTSPVPDPNGLLSPGPANLRHSLSQVSLVPQVASRSIDPDAPLFVAGRLRDALRAEPRRHVSIFLQEEVLETIEITFSNAMAARRRSTDTRWLIVDRLTPSVNSNISVLDRDVRKLARKLAQADPQTFGLLNCKGVMRKQHPRTKEVTSYDFIFRAPDNLEVLQCLRQSLINDEGQVSLTRRVGVAKELAKSVSYVHTFNFVHKNIRPESILLFDDTKSKKNSTYLVGFDNFRSADGVTNMIGDGDWDRNLYRHPSRQGEYPDEEYKMQHDIYSLGICLLEIGLWQSFVGYSTDANPRPQPGRHYQLFQKWTETSGKQIPTHMANQRAMLGALSFLFKDYFMELAMKKLPQTMGDTYAEVVMTCLTCLDKENDDFGAEEDMADSDGILVGVRFIERILLRLNEISV